MEFVCVRDHPQLLPSAIAYFQDKWANEKSMMVYQDCITRSLTTASALPAWYLMLDDERIIGCAGLIANDFISRQEATPWLCALFVEEDCRMRGVGSAIVNGVVFDAHKRDFKRIYLCTDHVGYYERFGFVYNGQGYHPWGEESRVYLLS